MPSPVGKRGRTHEIVREKKGVGDDSQAAQEVCHVRRTSIR